MEIKSMKNLRFNQIQIIGKNIDLNQIKELCIDFNLHKLIWKKMQNITSNNKNETKFPQDNH